MQNTENNGKAEHSANGTEENNTDIKAENAGKTDEKTGETGSESKYKELNDKYLRLYSEFENYRKRSIRERSDILKTATEEVFKAILPVIDDFERALRAHEGDDNVEAVKEGMQLIYNKLRNIAQQKGLSPFDSLGETFDPDTMEAITHIEAAEESQKGKVVDEIEKGYKLGDKVIRFAKVVVAR